MTDQKYHGWTNWDTWNCNLWLTNEEDSYKQARRACCARSLRNYWESEFEGKDDIDTDKVNFDEIYEAINE